jgi:hypothetical protein
MLLLVAGFPHLAGNESDGARESAQELLLLAERCTVEDPRHVDGSTSDALSTAHLCGETAPIGWRQNGLHEWQGLILLVREVIAERHLHLLRHVGEGVRTIIKCGIDRREQRIELGVFSFHLVDEGQVSAPTPYDLAELGPKVDVLDAVVEEKLGLEVLPPNRGSAAVTVCCGRNEPIEVTPEGVVGCVHHGEVDPVPLDDGH